MAQSGGSWIGPLLGLSATAAGLLGVPALAEADPDDFAGKAPSTSSPTRSPATAAPIHRALPRRPRMTQTQPAPINIYAHTQAGMLTPVTRRARYLVYVPDSQGNGVYVINPRTYRVIDYFHTGAIVQHVVPAWDLRTLYATNDIGNSLTPIDPDTGRRAGPNIPVADLYNMYFTPDGRHAIVVEEARETLAFRDPHTFALQKALPVGCPGVDHMDFSADGKLALASCEFSGKMARVDLRTQRITGYLHIGGSPQDVKLSPDGRTFYVANRYLPSRGASGVQVIDARTFRLVGFIRTRLDAHGLYISRDTKDLYVTNRAGGGGDCDQVCHPANRRGLADSRYTRHGQRQPGRESAMAGGALQQRGVRDLHENRSPDRADPRRSLTPRFVRVAAARTLLDRTHRRHAIAPRGRIAAERLMMVANRRACERDVKICGGGLVDHPRGQHVLLASRCARGPAACIRAGDRGAVPRDARAHLPVCPP